MGGYESLKLARSHLMLNHQNECCRAFRTRVFKCRCVSSEQTRLVPLVRVELYGHHTDETMFVNMS